MSKDKKEKEQDKGDSVFSFSLDEATPEEPPRVTAIYNDITEETASEVVGSFMYFLEDKSSDPIKFVISSNGGDAHEMFSMYDIMKLTMQEKCEVHTLGLGKVMSAAVVLLAAGTKGKRKIGRNCRVMIHPVAGGIMGDLADLENDAKEIRQIQKNYISCLAKETNLKEEQIRRIIKKKINCYISAEKAVEYGIADIII